MHKRLLNFKFSLIIMTLFVSANSQAVSWQEFYINPGSKHHFSIDVENIIKLTEDTDIVDVSIKNQYLQPSKYGATHTIARYIVDCDYKTIRNYHSESLDDNNLRVELLTNGQRDINIESAIEDHRNVGTIVTGRSMQEDDATMCQTIRKLIRENRVAPFKGMTEMGIVSSKSLEHTDGKYSIPLRKRGGVFEVMATINSEIKVYFVVDSGAADVTISESLAKLLVENGSISRKEVIGKMDYSFANGASSTGTVLILKSLDLGGHVLRDVRAVVLVGANVPLLLGQSALQKLGSWSINGRTKMLDISYGKP